MIKVNPKNKPKYNVDRRELIKHNIVDLEIKAKDLLINIVRRYTTPVNANLFIFQKKTLNEVGICNGVSILIDKDLKQLHPELCILSSDTIDKFISDINRDFKFVK